MAIFDFDFADGASDDVVQEVVFDFGNVATATAAASGDTTFLDVFVNVTEDSASSWSWSFAGQ